MSLRVKNFNDNESLIKDIDSLLVHITNIVNKYKVDLKREESVVRIEKFHKYDRKLIDKTSKDSRLFSIEGNKLYPNKLYSYEYIDDIDIYENRFVASLLLALKKEISDSYFKRFTENLPFLKAGISYGKYGTYQLLDKFAMNNKQITSDYKDDLNVDLLNKINVLLRRDFFKKVSIIPLNDVEVTNTLIGEEDYFACYDFYRRGLNRNKNYKNSMIDQLKKVLKNDKKINPDDKNMIAFASKEFVYRLKLDHELTLKLENFEPEEEITYHLDIRVGLFSNQLIIKLEDKETKIEIESAKDIVEIFESLSTFVAKRDNCCPVCLKPLDEEEFCSHCMAKFKRVKKDKKPYAWIYNPFEIIWRSE